MPATVPDLLRLVAVPAMGWAAYRDLQVRRVPNQLWLPLAGLGLLLLAWDAWAVGLVGGPRTVAARLFMIRVLLSLGVVVPLAYLAWRLGAFGGADAKAVMALTVLFPATPYYAVGGLVLPLRPGMGVFGMTIFTNGVLLAAAYPAVLALRNLATGDHSLLMVVGKRVDAASITERHGRLLETPDGATRTGLDIDALRMYLRWRGVTLDALRAAPAEHRDPDSLPDEPKPPTDGAIGDGGRPAEGDPDAEEGSTGTAADGVDGRSQDGADGGSRDGERGDGERADADYDDPWGAAAFLDDVPHAWGTSPQQLRDGLEVLTDRDRVWYSPGIPFVVPLFAGLVLALTYGDLLVSLLRLVGLVP